MLTWNLEYLIIYLRRNVFWNNDLIYNYRYRGLPYIYIPASLNDLLVHEKIQYSSNIINLESIVINSKEAIAKNNECDENIRNSESEFVGRVQTLSLLSSKFRLKENLQETIQLQHEDGQTKIQLQNSSKSTDICA